MTGATTGASTGALTILIVRGAPPSACIAIPQVARLAQAHIAANYVETVGIPVTFIVTNAFVYIWKKEEDMNTVIVTNLSNVTRM